MSEHAEPAAPSLDTLRYALSEAAARETAAVRALIHAQAELEQAQAAYRQTREAFEAAYRAHQPA